MKANNETQITDQTTYLTPSDAAPQKSLLTVDELRASLTKRQRELGKTEQQSKNMMSALSQFQKFSKATDESYADEIFGTSFDNQLNEHILAMSANGYSQQSVRDRLSLLLKIKEHFQELLANSEMPTSFADCLKWAMRRKGVGLCEVVRYVDIDKCTLGHWVRRRVHPSPRLRPAIIELEKYLQLEPGSLISRSGVDLRETLKKVRTETKLTAYSARVIEAKENPYALNDPHEGLRKEWADYVRHKTAAVLPLGEKRNSSWRIKPHSRVTRRLDWAGKTLGEKGYCVTAFIAWQFLCDIFGFISRPDLAGSLAVPAETLSLAWLSDSERVLACIQYQYDRSGAYTRGTYTLISYTVQMLRPVTGYLWQKVDFADKLPEEVHAAMGYDRTMSLDERRHVWQRWCESNRQRLYEIYKQLKEQNLIKKGRNPEDVIRNILDKRRPIEAIIEMVGRMKEALPSLNKRLQRLAFERDILFIQMLMANPLRIHNYSIMTWRSDNSGNLYQTEDGAWRIRFSPEDFKNQKGAAKNPYDVGVSKHLWKDIEHYLKEIRPHLQGANECDFVFRQSKANSPIGEIQKAMAWATNYMSLRVLYLTRTFIPNSQGFGPHAFRHIIATDYLKNHPHQYMSVAFILHDTLRTVMSEYAHVSTGHGFSLYTDYLDKLFEQPA
ncbi:hypothetical protein [Burkholderia pseudomallei]|uniref:hypothetical protein n=1 Tax=Burkholderia pseudomallei TaxID=28450 RepID=UPI00053861B2|nr:hypothetical protein [Burkholderia pseudomallei]KGW85339.1 hypothetical protein Y030_2304 [Burkholderia pseudomallei MSHR332]